MRVFGFILFITLLVGIYPIAVLHSPTAWAQDEEGFDDLEGELEGEEGFGDEEFDESFEDDDSLALDEGGEEEEGQEAEEGAGGEEFSLEEDIPEESDLDDGTVADEGEMELEPLADEDAGDAVEELPPAEALPDEGYASSPEEGQLPVEEFDQPDLGYEARLYDIYINYHSEPTPLDQWSVIVGGRESEAYPIQRGDTLWGISEAFFSDGNFWPKIWSLNSAINNPHLIEPGNQIRFLLGDESDAPAFTVTEGDEEGEESEEGVEDEVVIETEGAGEEEEIQDEVVETKAAPDEPGPRAGIEDIEIPPPERVSRPVVRKFPPSFPEWQNDNILGTYDELGISVQKRPDIMARTKLSLLNYVEEESPKNVGEVREAETGGLSASDFQYVYVQVKKGEGRSGDKFLVIQEGAPLQRSSHLIENTDNFGVGIEVQGVVSLVDSVANNDDSVAEEFDLFRAIVTKAHNPVNVGAKLVKDRLSHVNMTTTGPRSSVVAQIYGGTEDPKRLVFTTQSIAYLNRGSEDGLQPGQVLPIRSNRASRVEGSIVNENSRPIGWLKIARVTPNLATAVVVKAFEDIIAGDLTGQGDFIAMAEGASEDDLAKDALDDLEGEDEEGFMDEDDMGPDDEDDDSDLGL